PGDGAARAVRCAQGLESWRQLTLERLNARRSINVRDRRQLRSPLAANREDAGHVAGEPCAAARQIEIDVGGLDRRYRRKGPELLAILDVAIEPVAHLDRVRRGQDAAMTERARPELGGAVHPTDAPARGEVAGDQRDQG